MVKAEYNLLQIGFGNMGKAILEQNIKKLKNINATVIDPNASSSDVKILQSHKELDNGYKADILVFAVKPQIISDLISDYKNFVTNDTIIISILAGTKIAFFKEKLGDTLQIVRLMPNMGAKIAESMSFAYSDNLRLDNKILIENYLNSFGDFIWLDNENKFHAATAVAGSGPAYYFLFLEIFTNFLKENGFSEIDAQKAALKTASSSIKLAESGNFKELISTITSKGGTTEAALNSFKDSNIREIFNKAVEAATKRSGELS